MNTRLIALFLTGLSLLNPAYAANTISLAGEWRFEAGGKDGFARELPGKIRLPGTTDEAKAGVPNPVPPSLDGLYRPNIFTGPAWYQRDIEIPDAWKGKRITLTLERVHWVTKVWVDDMPAGTQDGLSAPQVFDLGSLSPGKHRLTILVDNTPKHKLGLFASVNYEGTQTNWNGIVGKIELAASDPVAIENVQVFPDVDRKLAKVRMTVANVTGKPVSGEITLSAKARSGGEQVPAKTIKFDAKDARKPIEIELPMGDNIRLWDEFSPSLYDLAVTLKTGGSPSFSDEKAVTFGMRKIATDGTQFTLNGRPIFLRGTLECAIFPLTGYPPTDVASWTRICRIIKSYGLNTLRFHSWTPPEAAFTAADEEGIYIQTEAPQANVKQGDDPERDKFIAEESRRILAAHGNHPSFLFFTFGNEMNGPGAGLAKLIDEFVAADSRHLYSSVSNGFGTDIWTKNRQFTVDTKLRGVGGPGTEREFKTGRDGLPQVSHEIGQWTFLPDFNEIKKYTGVLEAKNFELVREQMKEKGILDLAPKMAEAVGKQAILLYKEEIEVLLRTPGHAGFHLLDLHDYPGQGTALIGPLDPFWDSKGFVTPEAYREFCGPTVPLLRMPKRTYTAGEPFEARIDVANFGPADLPAAEVVWTIKDESGKEVASGTMPAKDLPTGKLTQVGNIQAGFEKAGAPAKLVATVLIKGTGATNQWDLWVYPESAAPNPPPDVVVCEEWNDAAKAALADGKKVLALATNVADSLRGSFKPVFWSPIWFKSNPATMGILCDPKHPALAKFPTESYSNWQWWDLINQSRSIILDSTPAGLRPIVQVVDNFARNHKLGVLFEARVGQGRLLVCSINLKDNLDKRPAAKQFLESLYSYIGSPQFAPQQELSIAALDKLLAKPVSKLAGFGAKVLSADSEAPDFPAANAIDGNPATIWHTVWDPTPAPMPHQLVIDMGRELEISGVTYLPRADAREGRIKDCEVFCSNDPEKWGEPAAKATFKDGSELHKIPFNKPLKARYLKFVVLSEIKNNPYASAAEIDVLPIEP